MPATSRFDGWNRANDPDITVELNQKETCDRQHLLSMEGVVAKWKSGQYVASDRRSSWVKIKNPTYTQAQGRDKLFEEMQA